MTQTTMATNVGNPVALDGNGTETGVASKVKKAASTVMGSVIDSLDSEQVQTILSTSIDLVLATGESLPVVEHLAALLIKFKNKAEELVATVQDAHLKLKWAERVLVRLRLLPMPGEDTKGLEGAKRECLREAMEAVQQLVEDAMSIANAGAGAASCMSCMSCCSTAAAAHFNKETFDEAKDNVAKALKDLELILAMDTNDVVHRLEDMATASAASHQKDMEKMFSMLQTLSSSSSTSGATAEVPSSGAAPPSLNVISSGGGGSVVQPAAQKQAQEHLDEAVLLLGESQQKQQEQASGGGGGGGGSSSSSSSAAEAADLSLNAASAVEAALDTLPAGAKVAPELYIVGAVGYQGGGRFAQAAAKYALAVEVSVDAPAGGGGAAAAADFPPSASDGSNAEKKKKSASAESAEEGLRDVIKTMVDATVTKAKGGGGGGSLGVGAAKDVKAAIVSVLESEGLQSDELAAIIDRTAEEVLQERARAQEPPHMKVRFGRDIRESGGCAWVPDTTTK